MIAHFLLAAAVQATEPPPPIILPDSVCTYSTLFVDDCFTARGRFEVSAEHSAIVVEGTGRVLDVESAVGCVLPARTDSLISGDKSVLADFVVRPLTPAIPGETRRVCVASASVVRAEPTYSRVERPSTRPRGERLAPARSLTPRARSDSGRAFSSLVVLVTTGGLVLFLALLVRATWRSRYRGSSQRAPALETTPRALKFFGFKNVLIPDDRGTTEVDLILVGNTGVFVIEQKQYNAWIFGSEDDEKWTARYGDGSSYQFQNPLRQNYRHVMALVGQLRLPIDRFHSIVAFSGTCELKTPVPSNVLVGDYEDYVRWTEGIRLTDVDVSKACEVLLALESKSTDAAFEVHIARLRDRFSSTTTCPRCGSPLVARRSRKSTSDGEPFLGCSAYPKCTYIKKVGVA